MAVGIFVPRTALVITRLVRGYLRSLLAQGSISSFYNRGTEINQEKKFTFGFSDAFFLKSFYSLSFLTANLVLLMIQPRRGW